MGKSGADATSTAPPSGAGMVAGMGETFSLDLNSGQGTFSLPFDVPDGVAGHKPRVVLEYVHANGNGPFGFGWKLRAREIRRRVDLGVPGEGAAEVFLDGSTELRAMADGSYRPIRETTYSHYERVGDGWVVTEKDGSRQFFGTTAAARVTDPDDASRVHAWLLERHEDACGNAVDYAYVDHDGWPYPSEIRYARFVVRFAYESRPDVVLDGHAGFLRRITRRCQAVNLHLADGDRTVRTLALAYEAAPLSGLSLMTSARLTAHGDGQPDVVKNPVAFSYSTFDPERRSVRFQGSRPGDAPPPPLTDPETALVALDDLPLPGIVVNRNGRHVYWGSDGAGAWRSPRPLGDTPFVASFAGDGVALLDVDASGGADMLVADGPAPLHGYYENRGADGFGSFVAYPRAQRVLPPLESGRVRLGDLDGDGAVDALHTIGRGFATYRNRGRDGWVAPTLSPNGDRLDFGDALTQLADMTGDGMPDVVRVRSGRVEYWPNLGHGRFGAPVVMANSPRLSGIARAPEQLVIADVDGDGCSDLIRVSSAGVELYVNRSGTGFADAVTYAAVPAPIPGTVRAVDLDGAGRAGLLYNSVRGSGTGYVAFGFDQATPPYLLTGVDNGAGLVSEIDYAPLVRMALDDRTEGRVWDTFMPFPIWVVQATRETDTVRGRRSEVRYRYHDGHYDPLFRRFHGFREVDKLEVGDESRADVLTRYRFLMDQAAVPGQTREHAHLDRMLAEVEVLSLDGTPDEQRPLRREETEYTVEALEPPADGTPRVFVGARVTRKVFTERTDDVRVEERAFEYDAFGNVVREVTRGHGTRAGAPVPERLVTTEIEYATDAARRTFKLARVVKRDAAGAIVTELRRRYDDLPPGELTRGLMTREEHLALARDAFDAHYGGMDAAALGYFEQPDADGAPAMFALEAVNTYTPQGAVATTVTGAGRSTEKVYDADGLYVVEEVANGKRSRRVNDEVTGKPLELVAASGERVRMTYDAFGRLTRFMVADDTPEAPTRALVYDDVAVPHSIALSYRIDATARARTVTYYDGSAKELQKRAERAPGDVVVSGLLAHNAFGQTKEEYEPTLDTTLAFSLPATAGRAVRRMEFDGAGRPRRTVNYNGAVSSAVFTPFEVSTFDAHDLDTGHPHFNTPRREEVDAWNQRTAVHETGDDGTVVTTRFDVGLFGELLALGDGAGTIVSYTYDARGNQLSLDHRDAGRREQWLDCHNDIVRTRDAAGNDVSVDRDAEGRVTEVRLGGAVVETFAYDDTTAADGRLVDTTYPNGRQQFAYDPRGFLERHTVTVDGDPFELRYEHNDMGRQTAVTYPDGTRLARTYTGNGLVASIDGVIDAVAYDARNLPTRIDHANGVTTTITYEDGPGHVATQRSVGPGGTVLEDAALTYDELMQLVGQRDAAPGAAHDSAYAYDGLHQLRGVEETTAAGTSAFQYAYDGGGHNLTTMGENGWKLGYRDPARPDRLTTIERPGEPVFATAHDANGNLTALPGQALRFNFKNQLAEVTLADGAVVSYDYDYRGNRVRRRVQRGATVTSTIFLGRLTEIRDGTVRNFALLQGRRVALLGAGQTRWIHSDPLGSARFFSDENGNRIAQIAYHPFGTERGRNGVPVIRTFARHDFDEETGLIYMGHRWYAPQLGRFITPDPLYLHQPERSEGDPVKLRLYTYVGNRPLDQLDPSGLSFWSVVGAIVGVIVGVVLAVVIVAAFASGIGFGLLAVAGLIALVTVSYVVAANNQGSALGEFFRGFMIGLNAGLNATFLAMMGPVGAFLGGFVGTMIFLSAFDSIASNEAFQGILGWSNWLMPMSWLVIGLGAAMWILNGLGHLIFWEIPNLWGGGIQFFRITGFRMDWSTGMLATKGGWIANLNTIDTAYNMGFFAYVDANDTSSDWHLNHEAGHNLNLAVFGSVFHFVGFIHEMGTPAGSGAFSEVQADSNTGLPGMWS